LSYRFKLAGLDLKLSNNRGHRILYFHQVTLENPPYYDGGISPERFLELLFAVRKLGFRFIPLEEALSSQTALRGTVSLCSDDGLACNYHSVLPILEDLGIGLCVFLIGKCIDNKDFAWNHLLMLLRSQVSDTGLQAVLPEIQSKFSLHDTGLISSTLFSVAQERRDELIAYLWERFGLSDPYDILHKEQPFLSSAQLSEMSLKGVTLALHSHTHADLSRLGFKDLKQELLLNIEALEQRSLPWQPWLAFPYGRQCSMEHMRKLRQELGIERFFGIRFQSGDNRPEDLLWQRIGMETDGFTTWRDLLLKPFVRRLKG